VVASRHGFLLEGVAYHGIFSDKRCGASTGHPAVNPPRALDDARGHQMFPRLAARGALADFRCGYFVVPFNVETTHSRAELRGWVVWPTSCRYQKVEFPQHFHKCARTA